MDRIFDLLTSPSFRGVMFNLSLVCLFLAVGITLVAFTFYGRGREANGASPDQERWILLFATWRDSLIITLLFTAQGILYRFADFSGLSEVAVATPLLYAPILQPLLNFLLDILIFIVAALRIIAITRWLASRNPAA